MFRLKYIQHSLLALLLLLGGTAELMAQFPVNIGRIPAGKTITICYEKTVNDNIPNDTEEVCEQGLLVFQNPNFGPSQTSFIVTDDPSEPGMADTTCTDVQVCEVDAICQDITVYLDGAGNVSITGSDVDGGSTATCGIASLSVSPNSFDCGDLGGGSLLYGVDRDGNYIRIDPASGNGSPVASITSLIGCGANSLGPTALGYDPITGIAWAKDNDGCFSGHQFDPSNGTATSGSIATTHFFQGLAVYNGVWYAVTVRNPNFLWTFDPLTGNMVQIGATGVASGFSSLAIDPATGIAYAAEGLGGTNIHTIDLNTGIATLLGDAGVVIGSLQFQNGVLYAGGAQAASGNLYTINTNNGAANLVGPTGLTVAITGLISVGSGGGNQVTLTVTDTNGNTDTCNAMVTVLDTLAPVIMCPADLTIDCGDLSCVEVGVVYAVHNGGVIGGDPLPQLGTLDPATGAFTLIGDLRDKATGELINVVSSLAISEEGILYGVTNSFGGFNPRALYKINACTGLASLVGTYDSGNPSGIKGIAFDDAQRLIGLEWEGNGQDVFEFNLGTGAATKIFDDALDPLWYGAAEKDPNSNLIYIASWTDRLIRTFDPVSGVVNVVVNTPVVSGATVGDIFFGQDGYLYLTTGRRAPGPALYRIDVPNETSTKVADFTFPNGRGIPAVTSTFNIIPQTGVATATDNCGDPTIAFSDSVVAACGKTETIYRTWMAADSSGNSISCQQIITVIDTTAPVAPMAPADITVACASDVPIPVDLTALDCCDGAITVSPLVQVTPGSCINDFIEVRTWTFTDLCGNSSSVSQTITVLDTLAPVPSPPPADLTVACAADVPAPVDLTATDNCDGDITVSPVIQITPGECINDFIEVRTWTFTDTCGNTSSVSQTIIVSDTLAPVPPTPPADVTVACASDVPAPVDLTATDNCDGDITVSPTIQILPGDCANDFVEIRTWAFTDTCGNSSSVSQTITVNDTIRPTWVRPLPPRVLMASCGMIPPPDTLMATDNCGGPVTVTFIQDTLQAGQGFEYDSLCIRRRWFAEDECGNRRRRTQRIYVVDCPDPCDITGIRVGPTMTNDSTNRVMGGPVCNDDGTYNIEICIQWKNNPIPDFIEVEINGTGGFIQIPIDGPQDFPEKCFVLENLPANGRYVTIFARIGREGCTYRARDLFRAPDRCDPPPTDCDITDANIQIAPTCTNGTVSTCIMLEGVNLPADASNAMAVVGGVMYPISQYNLVPGGAIVCIEGLPADGGNKDLFIKLENGCTITKRAFLQMPRTCDGDPGDDPDDDCDITGIRFNQAECNRDGTYDLEFVVTYNDMPAGQLAVEVGHGSNKSWSYHAVTGSPQTITVAGLPAVGGYANVFLKSNDVGGCTWYERSWYRAPSDCGRARDGEFATNLDQVRVYPNPSEGKFFLLIEQDKTEMIEVAVSNAVGQVVKTLKVESNREEVLDLDGMPEGIYTLRIMQGEAPVYKQVQVQR